jgi:MFS transporter, MHS family, alpha-ketoglutarate permease
MTRTDKPVGVHHHRVIGNVIRGCVGNLVEWYDWFAYAAFSVFCAHAFFPSDHPPRSCCRSRSAS